MVALVSGWFASDRVVSGDRLNYSSLARFDVHGSFDPTPRGSPFLWLALQKWDIGTHFMCQFGNLYPTVMNTTDFCGVFVTFSVSRKITTLVPESGTRVVRYLECYTYHFYPKKMIALPWRIKRLGAVIVITAAMKRQGLLPSANPTVYLCLTFCP
jgi:hypothetical protein